MIEQTISVTVPITNLYWTSYQAFFKRHGCRIEKTTKRDELNKRELCRITFPQGTRKEPVVSSTILHYKLILPDGTELEERQTGGSDYSFLFANVPV